MLTIYTKSVVVRKFFNVSFSRIQFPFSQVSLAKVINVLKANLRSLLALAFEREREKNKTLKQERIKGTKWNILVLLV